jgi:hypothetical protein
MNATGYKTIVEAAAGKPTDTLVATLSLGDAMRTDAIDRQDFDTVKVCNTVLAATVDALAQRDADLDVAIDAWCSATDGTPITMAQFVIGWFAHKGVTA